MPDKYQPLISVIVPIYNVELYLNRCITSIVQQTYHNLEIILVDDGSNDRSCEICDVQKLKDNRIKVIHKKNGGLSDARNVGIQESHGEYIMFVDSDDYINDKMCEILLKEALNTESDIVGCNFYWSYSDNENIPCTMSLKAPCSLKRNEFFKHFMMKGSVDLAVVWNKLYKKRIWKEAPLLKFPLGRFHEDEFTNYKFYYAASLITIIDQPLYYYVQRQESIMSKYGIKNVLDMLECIKERLIWADGINQGVYNIVEASCIRMYFNLLNTLLIKSVPYASDKSFKEIEKCILKGFKQTYSNPYLSKTDFIKFYLAKLNLFIPALKIKYFFNSK